MRPARSVKRVLTAFFRALGLDIRRYAPRFDTRCVTLRPAGNPKGWVLLSYILEPFLLKTGQPISSVHNNHLESTLIARTFLDLGYGVDVIHFRNDEFTPAKNYAFFVSARTHLETIAKRLNEDCIKIAHLDTSHFALNNHASYNRLLGIQQRRGISLPGSVRLVEHNRAIECADYGAVLGGRTTLDSYRYAGKHLFALPVPAITDQPWIGDKDFASCRNRFLWLGSTGFVHKGLDLTLEAFVGMPDRHLTVCGPIDSEPGFRQAFHKELYQTANIQTAGWVDISGHEFHRIAQRSAAIVYPSCAEGQATSVINCVRAGLIPVVTREAGIDIADFGVVLKDASIGEIRDAVERLAGLPAPRLREMSHKAWEYAHENHSAEKYTQAYRAMIARILEDRGIVS